MLRSGAKRFISPPVRRTLRQHNLGTEGWNRTNVEGFKDLRPPTERPRHGTPGWTRTSVSRFRRAVPKSPRPQARSQLEMLGTGVEDRTLLHLFVGAGLSTRKRPRHILAVGAGLEPAHELVNSQSPYHLATPQNWSGTSDLNRDSLGPRPSGLIRFPSPRMSKIWSERLESNQRPRASETRALIQLSYAHKNTGTGGRGRTGISSLGPKCSIR